MRFIVVTFTLCGLWACAQPLSTDSIPAQSRTIPKSYQKPTAEVIAVPANWIHGGELTLDGQTQVGSLSRLSGFDTQLEAGMLVELMGFSSGWTSMHVFGARPDAQEWTEVVTLSLSAPIDPEVESGQLQFEVPFSGHYLVMLEPVLEEEVEYLLRLECREGCF